MDVQGTDASTVQPAVEARFSRFSDAPWFPKGDIETEVVVGGAGGIGSWLCFLLMRAGFVCHVYDFDVYEEHNMAGQLCRKADMGKSKVSALADTIMQYSNAYLVTYNERYTKDTMSHKYMFSGFDNMEARKTMFTNWKETFGSTDDAIFIDGRLSAEQLQIFCVRGNDAKNIERYEKEFLFTDGEVEDAVCTFKQTSHAATMIASHMVGFFTNFISNVVLNAPARSIPFYWEYYIPVDFLQVEA